MSADTSTPLVHIVTLTDQDYDAAVIDAEASGGSVNAVAEHLAQWDFGTETDEAALLFPQDLPTRADLSRQPHQLHPAHASGLDYLVQIDHQVGLYALYRTALTKETAA